MVGEVTLERHVISDTSIHRGTAITSNGFDVASICATGPTSQNQSSLGCNARELQGTKVSVQTMRIPDGYNLSSL